MDTTLPPILHVIAWTDPVVDALGFDGRSTYSEHVALSQIGPSSTLCWRFLATALDHSPDGFELDVAALAHRLGLGNGVGRSAPVSRALRRLATFHLAYFPDEASYAVRRRMPPLSGSQVRRLSPELHRLHVLLLARHDTERLSRAN